MDLVKWLKESYQSIKEDSENIEGSETTEDFNDGRMFEVITLANSIGLNLSDLRGE